MKTMRTIFEQQKQEILRNVDRKFDKSFKARDDISGLFDEAAWNGRITKASWPILVEMVVEGGRGAFKKEGVTGPLVAAFNIRKPEVVKFVQNHSYRFAKSVDGTLAKRLRKTISEGLAKGERIYDLRKRVLALPEFKDKGKQYADLVARTEANRAENGGKILAWKELEYEGKMWQAASNACVFCAELNGKIISIDEPYYAEGDERTIRGGGTAGGDIRMRFNYSDVDSPPLHGFCRCRLRAVKVLEEAA